MPVPSPLGREGQDKEFLSSSRASPPCLWRAHVYEMNLMRPGADFKRPAMHTTLFLHLMQRWVMFDLFSLTEESNHALRKKERAQGMPTAMRKPVASFIAASVLLSALSCRTAAQSIDVRYGIGFVHVDTYYEGVAYLGLSSDVLNLKHTAIAMEVNGWLGGGLAGDYRLTYAAIDIGPRLAAHVGTPLGTLSLNALPALSYIIYDKLGTADPGINPVTRHTKWYLAYGAGVSLEQQFMPTVFLIEDVRFQLVPDLNKHGNRFFSVGVKILL